MTYIKHNSAKANALRGKKIGGGGISLTPPGASRAHQSRVRGIPRVGLAPRAFAGSPVLASFTERGKKGENPTRIDVLDLRDMSGGAMYERTKAGVIRKVVQAA